MPIPSLAADPQLAEPIQMILSDVDGVLTDGRIIYDNAGVETKAFHVRDGLGIKLWQNLGFHFGILTARSSQVVRLRAAELGVEVVRQGVSEKWPAALEIIEQFGLTPPQVCYIGDDLPDLCVLNKVGLSVTVADASLDVRQSVQWTTRLPGGGGAVRELVERLLRGKDRWEESVSATLQR